ncbi:Protein W02A2.5 [Aphelenchoides avenae]|nr:Protein W02A2.5 [Aphelenchus avenae]
MWNVFNPYSFWTWMAILAMFVIQAVVCMVVLRTEVTMKMRKSMAPFEAPWKLLRLQLLQPNVFLYSRAGEYFPATHTSFPASFLGKFTVTIFAFVQCAILLSLYQSWLLTAILRPADSRPFKSADALLYMVDIQKYSLVTHDASNWFYNELSTSNDPYYRDLRKATDNNPVVRTRTLEESVELTSSERKVMVTQEDTAR